MRHTNPTVLLGLALWLAACLSGRDVLGARVRRSSLVIAMTVIFGLFSRPASIRPKPRPARHRRRPLKGVSSRGPPVGRPWAPSAVRSPAMLGRARPSAPPPEG